jgi:hypothetical protein
MELQEVEVVPVLDPLPLPVPEPVFDVPVLLEPVLELEDEVDVCDAVTPAQEISMIVIETNKRSNNACFDLPVTCLSPSPFSTG